MNADITLVIADDHPIMRRGMIDLIAQESAFKILAQVSNGTEALKAINQHKPTIAVLDIEMPDMNGLNVARAIRDSKLKTFVVLLTMYKDGQVFNAAVDAGVAGYVLKENAETELLACLRAVAKGDSFFSPTLSSLLLNRSAQANQLRKDKPGLDLLTPTERRILKLISEDKTSKEIADSLGISPRTVDNHRSNMGEKLDLRGSHSLLKFAYDNKSKL
jgi:DNA-binding NarL/FixJ family response regulator